MKRGDWGTIWAARASGGEFPGRDYLDSLPPSERAVFDRWIEYLAENGRIFNSQKFKQVAQEEPPLFAFKDGDRRLLGFFHSKGSFYISNGYRKKTKKIGKKERPSVERAHRIRSDTLNYLEEGTR